MATSATSQGYRAACSGRSGSAPPIGAIALAAAAFGSVLGGDAVQAGQLCGERDALLKELEMQFEETPQALGLSADGGVCEVLVSPEGGWTILVTYPKRPTCVIAMGEAWQAAPLIGSPA
jgi:hypothetical protein